MRHLSKWAAAVVACLAMTGCGEDETVQRVASDASPTEAQADSSAEPILEGPFDSEAGEVQFDEGSECAYLSYRDESLYLLDPPSPAEVVGRAPDRALVSVDDHDDPLMNERHFVGIENPLVRAVTDSDEACGAAVDGVIGIGDGGVVQTDPLADFD